MRGTISPGSVLVEQGGVEIRRFHDHDSPDRSLSSVFAFVQAHYVTAGAVYRVRLAGS